MSASGASSATLMDTDLYEAASKGDFELFKNYEQSLDRLVTIYENMILHIHLSSPFRRSTEFVEKVLSHCPELLWQVNEDGDIPLHIAAKYGHSDVVELLINRSKLLTHKDLESDEERQMLRITNKQEDTALHVAAGSNHLRIVEVLLVEGPNINYTANKSGKTPLYLAVEKAYERIAIEILHKSGSPSCGGPNGETAFHAAVLQNNDRLIGLLLKKISHWANKADESGWTPLHYAAYFGRPGIVKQIVEKERSSAYVPDKDRKRTALRVAACRGKADTMKEIIKKCPESCELKDIRGWNVLHYAVISKSDEVVKAIIENSSLTYLINREDVKGYTPLHLLLLSRPNTLSMIIYEITNTAEESQFLREEALFVYWNFIMVLDAEKKEKILDWMTDLGSCPLGRISISKSRQEVQMEKEEKEIPEIMEKARDSHLVAAALVATVTFAAAFTLPGGYIAEEEEPKQGTPILSRNAAFQAFVITDAIAMVLSTSSVFIHFLMVILGYNRRSYWLIRSAFWFIVLAMGAMVVAFVTGTYAVLAPSKGLAIAICVIGLSFFLLVFHTTIRLISVPFEQKQAENLSFTATNSLLHILLGKTAF